MVRRLVPGETGPTGGPAFTDVLGVCERWPETPDGEAVVRRDNGDVVAIPVRLIVSGKPVPERQSRLARVGREEIDRHLDSPGQRVWLGSVSQLSRRHGLDGDITIDVSDGAITCTLGDLQAHATMLDDWVVVDRIDDPRLLGAVLECAAEEGLGTIAFTDPRVAEFGAGLVDRS